MAAVNPELGTTPQAGVWHPPYMVNEADPEGNWTYPVGAGPVGVADVADVDAETVLPDDTDTVLAPGRH